MKRGIERGVEQEYIACRSFPGALIYPLDTFVCSASGKLSKGCLSRFSWMFHYSGVTD